MTEAQLAERHARSTRYAENVRNEERKRAFDLIEMAASNQPDDVATALWNLAAEIVRHK